MTTSDNFFLRFCIIIVLALTAFYSTDAQTIYSYDGIERIISRKQKGMERYDYGRGKWVSVQKGEPLNQDTYVRCSNISRLIANGRTYYFDATEGACVKSLEPTYLDRSYIPTANKNESVIDSVLRVMKTENPNHPFDISFTVGAENKIIPADSIQVNTTAVLVVDNNSSSTSLYANLVWVTSEGEILYDVLKKKNRNGKYDYFNFIIHPKSQTQYKINLVPPCGNENLFLIVSPRVISDCKSAFSRYLKDDNTVDIYHYSFISFE